MWGRFHSIQRNADQFRAKPAENLFVAFDYNAPPQTWQPVIRLSKKGEREIVNMRRRFIKSLICNVLVY